MLFSLLTLELLLVCSPNHRSTCFIFYSYRRRSVSLMVLPVEMFIMENG